MEGKMKRIGWGDIAKGIAIILVVMGHSYKGNICHFIFLFHMPVFFFLAGYFFNFDRYVVNIKDFMKNNANRLLIPVLVSTVIIRQILQADTIRSLLYGIGHSIPKWKIYTMHSMWFLYCLFLVRVLLLGFINVTKKMRIPIYLNLVIAWLLAYCGVKIGQIIKLPWSLDIALVALYIAYIGYLLRESNFFEKKKFAWIIIPVCCVLTYFDYKYFGLSMNNRFYSSNPFMSVNCAILMTMVLIYISQFIEKLKIFGLDIFLKYLGINSLIIMVYHGLAHSSIGPGVNTIWRIFVCILIIECFALIPFLKNVYSAVSIMDVFKRK